MNLSHIKKYGALLFAAVITVILHFIIYLGVYSNNPQTFQTIVNSVFSGILLYIFFLALCIVALFLGKKNVIRITFYTLLSVMTVHVFYNLYALILDTSSNQNGAAILVDAFLIWLSSLLIFSIWYWILDKQSSVGETIQDDTVHYDFLFPQNQTTLKLSTDWKPKFFDYVALSFFISTSFAPSDTLPVTKRAKFLMMTEALISLVIIGMVAARAISLIK